MWFFLEKLQVFFHETLFSLNIISVFFRHAGGWIFHDISPSSYAGENIPIFTVRRPKWGPAIPPGSPRDPVTARQSYWILRVFWVLTVDRNSGPFVGDFLECGKTRKRLLECWLKPQQFTQNPDKNNEIVVGQSIGIPYLIQQWHLIIAV